MRGGVVLGLGLLACSCGERFVTASPSGGASGTSGGGPPAVNGGSDSSSAGGALNIGGSLLTTGGIGNLTGGMNSGGGSITGGASPVGGSGGALTECSPGNAKCSLKSLQVCDAAGQWVVSQECPFVCSEVEDSASCTGLCAPGLSRCGGERTVETCDLNGAWVSTETCHNVCSAGICAGVCPEGETQCAGNYVQVCALNGHWMSQQPCDFVCAGEGICTGVCSPGNVDCLSKTPRTCNAAGQWVAGNECPFLCQAGICTGSCVPQTKRCLGSGTQTCSASGQLEAAVACPVDANEQAGCSGAGMCDRSCKSGFGNCTSAPGCESPLNTIANCLGCGKSCNANPNHGVGVCLSSGCGVTCNAGWVDFNKQLSDGCEKDLSTDPENCGALGKSCYGGSCSQSSCQFKIEKVIDLGGSGPVLTFQLDGDTLYVLTTTGQLVKRSADGSVATLASNLSLSNTNLVVDNKTLYFAETTGLAKLSTSGGPKTRITTQTASRLDVEGGYVYFTTGELDEAKRCAEDICPTQNTVYRVATSGGMAAETLKTFDAGAVSSKVSVVESQVYVGLRTSGVETLVTFDVGAPDTTTDVLSFATFIADFIVPSGEAFATDASENLWRAAAGATPELIGGAFTDSRKFGLAYDDTYVYGAGAQRSLTRVSRSGGSLTALGPNTNALLTAPMADSSYVYWAGNYGGASTVIYRVPRN